MDIYIENVIIGERYSRDSEKIHSENIPVLAGDLREPSIMLLHGDSLSIAESMAAAGITPCILNFANNDIAGGGFALKGSTQEEVLLKRTTLGGSLSKEYYPIDKIVDKYQYWDYQDLALIYSPDVMLIRNADYEIIPVHYKMSVVTCAPINNPRATSGRYMFASDREVTRRKIQMILDAATLRGHKNLIAGQWGCGAFGNPLEICSIWIDEITRRDIKVVFPIFDNAFGDTMRELIEQITRGETKNNK
jgi:uncharacterized protein (TIGR02452 family)